MSYIGDIFHVTLDTLGRDINEVQEYLAELGNVYADAVLSNVKRSGDKLSFDLGAPTLSSLSDVGTMLGAFFPPASTTIGLKTKGFIDAALSGQGKYADKAYFFKEDHYVGYNWKAERLESDFPQPLSKWGLPATFLSGIDAAVNGQDKYAGKTYFFKKAQLIKGVLEQPKYVTFHWDTVPPVMDRTPQLTSKWGLPTSFLNEIDAALDGQDKFAGYAYFFRGPNFIGKEFIGNAYVRYNWKKETIENALFPPPVAGSWAGVVEGLRVGLAKTLAKAWLSTCTPQLLAYIASVASGLPFPDKALMEDSLNIHFHINSSDVLWKKYSDIIVKNYSAISSTLDNLPLNVRYRSDAEAGVDKCGFSSNCIDPMFKLPYPMYSGFGGKINFTTTYATVGRKAQAAMLLYQCVHVVDPTALPYVFEHERAKYASLTPEQAVHNPSSYVCFAEHVFYRSDVRYGLSKPFE